MALKLITFDLDNTLWHTDPVIAQAENVQWQAITQRCPTASAHFTTDSLQQLKRHVIQQHPALRHKLSLLRIEYIFQILTECGMNPTQAREQSQQIFSEFLVARNKVELFPNALEVLEKLKKKYHVIALSNGNANLTSIGIDHLFHAHYHAENVARPKPAEDMFLAALNYAKVKAHESCHIGDHPEQDIEAARKVGFKTVWANILNQDWPSSVNKADADITHLDQLIRSITSFHSE